MASNSHNEDVRVRDLITEKRAKKSISQIFEKIIPIILFSFALITILTTIGIIYTLLVETIEFFKRVPIWDFFTDTILRPLNQDPQFVVLPLINGTIISSVIVMLVARPIGIMPAHYLSVYASDKIRRLLKPMLEVLAGIPTIVYGFFAFTFVTPLIRSIWPDVEATNILSLGIVMGIMIIPMIASLSEDAMSSVANSIREGEYALGVSCVDTNFKVCISD